MSNIRQISYNDAKKYINKEPYLPVKDTYTYWWLIDEKGEICSCIWVNEHEKRMKIECYFTDVMNRWKWYWTEILQKVSKLYEWKKQIIDCLLASKWICEKNGFVYKRQKTFTHFTIYRCEKTFII